MSLFKIPRTKSAKNDLRWTLVRKFGTSRKRMVDFITSLAGYSDRHDRFAIEFTVGAYCTHLDDPSKLWDTVKGEFGFGCGLTKPHEDVLAFNLFSQAYAEHKDALWYWGVDEAYESWRDSCTPYETFEGTRVDWSWEMRGRGGKHLCMTECAGINLECNQDELEERLMEREQLSNNYTDRWGGYVISVDAVKKLFIICVQNSIELTSANVSKDVDYRAAWRLWTSFCEDGFPATLAAFDTRARLADDARSIRDILASEGTSFQQGVFETICLLAGVQLKE